jgi:hypothetical protein
LRGAAYAELLEQRVEGDEKVEIDPPDIDHGDSMDR